MKNDNVGTGLSKEQEDADKRFVEIMIKALRDPEEPKPIEEYVDEAKTEQNMRLSDVPYDPENRHPSAPFISMRTYNCLRRGYCESLSDVLDIIEWGLLPGLSNFNQRCVENAIAICMYFCPRETKKRLEIADGSKKRLMRIQNRSKALLLSEAHKELLDKPIEEVIPQEYLKASYLCRLNLKTFSDLCDILSNGGNYNTEECGTGNLFDAHVGVGLVQILRICEDILTS